MSLTLGHYLTLGAILFALSITGIFLNRKNVIIILMSIELILLAVNINLVAFSTHLGDIVGQVYALLVLTVAAAEAAELAARVRFDAVLWTVRPGAPSWSDAHDRLLSKIPAFVLLSDGYDGAFAASLKESGGFLLARPIRETEFEQVLAEVGTVAV